MESPLLNTEQDDETSGQDMECSRRAVAMLILSAVLLDMECSRRAVAILILSAVLLVVTGHAYVVWYGTPWRTACEPSTGATCFLSACDQSQHRTTCEVDQLFWHSCHCQAPTPCAHHDGTCHRDASGKTWEVVFRNEGKLFLLYVLVPILRSGVLHRIKAFFLCDRMLSLRPPGRSSTRPSFNFKSSKWQDLAVKEVPASACFGCGPRVGAVWVSVSKALGLHLSQVFLFWASLRAYAPFLPKQYWLAVIVGIKEIWYGALVVYGSFANPSFLLFTPASEADTTKSIQYFLDPDLFIAQCIKGCKVKTFADAPALIVFTIALSGAAGVAACAALVEWLQQEDREVMFPSLCVGYSIVGLGPLVFPVLFACGSFWRKWVAPVLQPVQECMLKRRRRLAVQRRVQQFERQRRLEEERRLDEERRLLKARRRAQRSRLAEGEWRLSVTDLVGGVFTVVAGAFFFVFAVVVCLAQVFLWAVLADVLVTLPMSN